MAEIVTANALWAEDLTANSSGQERKDFEYMLGAPPKGATSFDLNRPFTCYRLGNGQWHTEGTSTCGLVAERIWELSGVKLPWAGAPYKPGSAIGRMNTWAEKEGLKYKVTMDNIPEPGDILLLGHGTSEHEFVFLATDKDELTAYKVNFISMDGGQVEPSKGLQAIRRIERTFAVNGARELWDSKGRKIQYGVSLRKAVEKGLLTSHCTVPEDFSYST